MRSNFAVFILTHGRPDRLYTLDTLKKCGYTGKYYIIIDTEDKRANEYIAKYGDKVRIFDKKEESKLFDTADTFDDRRAIVYARNVSFRIAKELKLREITWIKHNKSYFPLGCFMKKKKIKDIVTLFKKKFYCPYVFTNIKNVNNSFKYIALCAGAGYHCLTENFNKIKQKNLLFITGDLKYHNWIEINENKLNFLDVGHELENFFVDFIAQEIANNFPQIKIKKIFSKQIKFLVN